MQQFNNRYGGKTLEEAAELFRVRNFGEKFRHACMSQIGADFPGADSLLKYQKRPQYMLVMLGNPGCGKTHISAALMEWALKRFNTIRVHREEDIFRKLRQAMSEGNSDYAQELEYLIDDDLIVYDDVASGLDPKKDLQKSIEWRTEVFYTFLDNRYRSTKPTIITSNLTRNEFQKIYSSRICDRLFAKENTIIDMFEMRSKRQREEEY